MYKITNKYRLIQLSCLVFIFIVVCLSAQACVTTVNVDFSVLPEQQHFPIATVLGQDFIYHCVPTADMFHLQAPLLGFIDRLVWQLRNGALGEKRCLPQRAHAPLCHSHTRRPEWEHVQEEGNTIFEAGLKCEALHTSLTLVCNPFFSLALCCYLCQLLASARWHWDSMRH